MIALRNSLIYILSFLCAGCDTSSELSFGQDSEIHSISYLKSLCTSLSTDIHSDIDICGVVVANDLFGEFYKTIVITDDTGGIEIAIDNGRLAKDYPIGSVVKVRCNGLTLGRSGGGIQLGKHPTGEYTVDRIPQQQQERYIEKKEGLIEQPAPTTTTIADLSARHVTSYIRIDDVGFAAEEQGLKWFDQYADADVTSYTDRHIVDTRSDTLIVRTSYRCKYADEQLPSGCGTICGIVYHSGGKYRLKVVNREFSFTE